MSRFELETKYVTISQAEDEIEKLIEKSKKNRLALNLLTGKIYDNGDFKLSSKARGAALSEFVGSLELRKDCIYLVGTIQPKPSRMKLLYTLIGFNAIFGVILISSGNPIFVVAGILFLSLPWINVSIARKGNHLKASLKLIFK